MSIEDITVKDGKVTFNLYEFFNLVDMLIVAKSLIPNQNHPHVENIDSYELDELKQRVLNNIIHTDEVIDE